MKIHDEINLPQASRYLISLVMKKGGTLSPINGTNAYLLKHHQKEYIFLGEFTPLMPYMYGIIFSNQKYWFEIVKELKIKHAWLPTKTQKKIVILMTSSGYFNALLEKNVSVFGNGQEDIKSLIKTENLKRINHKHEFIMPIKIKADLLKITKIPKIGEKVEILGNYDYEDVSNTLNKVVVKEIKKILKFLPGLPYIRLEIFIKNLASSNKYSVGKLLISPGENIFFKVVNSKNMEDAGKVLLSLMK